MRRPVSPSHTYTRLSARRLGLMHRSTLWLAADHILVVHETMTGESYRRFFFRDIRAVTIHRTRRRENVTGALVVLAILNLLPLMFLAAPDPGLRAVSFLAAGTLVWLGLLVANLMRGPSCETQFSTAAHDVVEPLSRLTQARRVIALLRPRILAAQAEPAPQVSPVSGDATS